MREIQAVRACRQTRTASSKGSTSAFAILFGVMGASLRVRYRRVSDRRHARRAVRAGAASAQTRAVTRSAVAGSAADPAQPRHDRSRRSAQRAREARAAPVAPAPAIAARRARRCPGHRRSSDPAAGETPLGAQRRRSRRRRPADGHRSCDRLMSIAWIKRGNPLARIGIVILFFGAAFLAKYAAENSLFPIELRFVSLALGAFAIADRSAGVCVRDAPSMRSCCRVAASPACISPCLRRRNSITCCRSASLSA